MKKYISYLILISMTSLLLCSCGQSSDSIVTNTDSEEASVSEGTINLKIWGAEDDAELLNTICSNFQAKYPEQTFNFTIEAQGESDCKDALLADVANAPDVFTFADDQFSTFCASGVLKPIENSSEISSRNSAGSVEACTMNNEIYAYPLTADNGYFLFYNKKYLDSTDVETFDALLEKAASLDKKVTFDISNGWYMYAFFGNTGLTVGLNDDGISNYCTWNDTENSIKGVDVANAMLDIASNPGFLAGGDSVLTDGANDDSVIAGVSGVWLSSALQEAWGDDLGACKLPTYTVNDEQVQLSSYAGYKLVGVNDYSENKEWAHTFADYMTSEECQTLRFEMRQQGPSNINAANMEAVKANVGLNALIAQSDYSSLQRIGSAYWAAATDFGELIIDGNSSNQDLQEVMDNLVSEITASN